MRILRWILLSLYALLMVGLGLVWLLEDDLAGISILAGVTIVSLPIFLLSIGVKDLCMAVPGD